MIKLNFNKDLVSIVDCFCPFQSNTDKGKCCGNWCPLFQLIEPVKFQGTNFLIKHRLKINCGKGREWDSEEIEIIRE